MTRTEELEDNEENYLDWKHRILTQAYAKLGQKYVPQKHH